MARGDGDEQIMTMQHKPQQVGMEDPMAAVVWPAFKVGAACGMSIHVLLLPVFSARSRYIPLHLSLGPDLY